MANTKVTGLTANTSPALTDVMLIIDDPGGTPASQKVTLANLKTGLGVPDFTNLTDWTPSVTQSGAVTATVTYAKYVLIGNLCYATCNLAITGSGTGNNDIIVGNLPKTPAANGCYGTGWVNDNGTAWYHGAALYLGSGIQFRAHNTGDDIGRAPNFALANSDAIMMTVVYPWTA